MKYKLFLLRVFGQLNHSPASNCSFDFLFQPKLCFEQKMLKKMETKPTISQWFWFRWQNCVALILNSVKRYWHFNSLEIHSIELQEQFQYRLCTKTELIRQCQFLRFSIITWRVHVFNQIQIIFYGFTHLIRPNQSWTELRCGTLLIVVV